MISPSEGLRQYKRLNVPQVDLHYDYGTLNRDSSRAPERILLPCGRDGSLKVDNLTD